MKTKFLFFFTLLTNLIFAQTKDEIQNLKDFANIYSVIRHFHPSDESAKMKWDFFAVYGVEEILKTKNQKEFQDKIKELFLPIAPSITFGEKEHQWKAQDTRPVYWCNMGLASGSKGETYKRFRKNLDEFNLKIKDLPIPEKVYKLKLSNNFDVNIPLIVYEINGKTIPEGNIEKFTKLGPNTFDKNTAIANFIIMWSGLRHFFPYQDEMQIDWDKILVEGIKATFKNKSEEENMFTLRKISHYFNDGHMWITYPKYSQINSFSPGIKTQFFRNTNQLVVTNILGDVPNLKKGDIITKINGENTKAVIDSIKEYWSGSDQYNINNTLRELFKGKENTELSINLEDGKLITLKRNYKINQNMEFFNQDNSFEMKELDKEILYLNLQNLTTENVESNIEYIRSFKKIILDLRGYPKKGKGGANSMIRNFFWDRNNVKFMAYPKIENPFFENVIFTDFFGWNYKKKHELNAKIVLLMHEGNGSYQESIPQYLKANNFVTTMGRRTGGVNGNINYVNLLTGMTYSFTGMKVRNTDGSQFHGLGLEPDIIIDYNLEGIKNGKDTFIEKAVEYLNKE
ncbi:S41 family peptidase [Chryseobacterium oryctis]|uniref:S41 family peptidase n=1 Tax=Chryseobacterium oryctis TaxID=2952618 RepID=A0ABT3HRD1_9FLAO|nr:S41 family peptidase [Chryseobacterium oryctis]MCW3162178.1 S41 family peptidase [Chryseobacterium oryctis]